MNKPTHYTYINNVKVYLSLVIELHTNQLNWYMMKNDVWHLVPRGMDLAGKVITEIKA